MKALLGLILAATGAAVIAQQVRSARRDPATSLEEALRDLVLNRPPRLWIGFVLLAFGAGLLWYELNAL